MEEQKHLEKVLKGYEFNPDTYRTTIYEAQRKFGGKFIPFDQIQREIVGGDFDLHDHWVDELIICILDELTETLEWLPFKHWKRYDNFLIKEVEIKFELIDILHFVVNLMQVIGADYTNIPQTNIKPSIIKIAGGEKVISTKSWILKMMHALDGLYSQKSSYYHLCHICDTLRQGFEIWGMSNEDIFDYYMSKNQENFDRQERGY